MALDLAVVRHSILRTAPTPPWRAAVNLMKEFNGGRLLADDMLTHFVYRDPSGRSGTCLDWELLDDVMHNNADPAPTSVAWSLPTPERAVLRAAVDIAWDRWGLRWLEPGDVDLVLRAARTAAS
ncbi:hypothetical protein NORO109296_26515 [Nocardiopsis rhodophaea]